MEPVEPPIYQSLAEIYDFVMRHVDYGEWAAYLNDLLTHFGLRPQAAVELACGTGNIALQLCALGCRVVAGLDASAAMLQIAREKATSAGLKIEFVQGDLRDLGPLRELGPFDAAVCIYDSFNYLLTLQEVDRALAEIHGILRPDSLFIFDVCTEQNSRRYFQDYRDREEGPGFSYERHSYYVAAQRLQMNHFRIHFAGQEKVREELHVQRIYPVAELVAALEASPFELLGVFDGFTFQQGAENSDRVHFALRRRLP